MKEFWDGFFEFLEKHLPGWITAFWLGKREGSKQREWLRSELRKRNLDIEKFNNKEKVQKDNASKSSDSIIRDAISKIRGRSK